MMKLLLSEKKIRQRVEDLAAIISQDFHSREIVLIGVLKGSFIFLADLARRIKTPVKIDFVGVASYGSGTQSCGTVKFTKDLQLSIRGKDVVIVEDIIDTGITLRHLYRRLKARRPRTLKVAALLDKPERRAVTFQADYVGFKIPDHFVVGYGLDCAEEYRNLPGIYAIQKKISPQSAQRPQRNLG